MAFPEGLPLRHFILCVDESKGSERAVEWAIENMYRTGDEFHLLHVIPPGQYVVLSTDLGMEEVVEDDAETQQRVEDHAKSFILDKFVSQLEAKKIPYQVEIVKFATDNDSIGSLVCKRAEQLNATAVVMAKHSKGTFTEFFVGSVTNFCTHHCKSPVLVIHAD